MDGFDLLPESWSIPDAAFLKGNPKILCYNSSMGEMVFRRAAMNVRTKRWIPAVIFAWALTHPAALPGQEKTKEITNQIFVNAISIAVTVQDRSGRYVDDLSQKDFRILESGRKQEITYFKYDFEAPLSLTVLLDVSGSMAIQDKLQECKEALKGLIAGLLSPRDEVSLLIFADGQVEIVAPFSADKSGFLAALEKAEAYGQTALNDAVAVSPEFADKGRNEKRAILLLTDGIENDSRTTPAEAVEIARRVDVPIYTVGYKLPLSEQRLQKHKRGADSTLVGIVAGLNKFSAATGGRAFFLNTSSELRQALGLIRRELKHQYILGYTSPRDSGGEYRGITVVISNKRYVVRTRQGY